MATRTCSARDGDAEVRPAALGQRDQRRGEGDRRPLVLLVLRDVMFGNRRHFRALDGFYVLRAPVPIDELDAPAVVAAYKNLKYGDRDFRHIKADDLDLRRVFHYLKGRVKAHVLICMLACYLTWHLRRAWAPLTFTDEQPPAPANPVARPAGHGRAGQGVRPA